MEAASLVGERGAITGWAALHWLGGYWFSGINQGGERLAVPVLSDHFVAARSGVAFSQERYRPDEIEVVDGLRVTSAVRSACFEMRYARGERAAVITLDMAAYSDLVSISEAAAFAGTLNGWTGIPQCRLAIAGADENTWSPMETVMREVWQHIGGYPLPASNRAVFDLDGRHVGTPDLIDDAAGVLGQYDGELHAEGSRRARDVQQLAAYHGLGLEVVTMLAADHRDGYRSFLMRLDQAYGRALARRRGHASQRWTLEPPAWWIDTTTVDSRRALDTRERRRVLGYRLDIA